MQLPPDIWRLLLYKHIHLDDVHTLRSVNRWFYKTTLRVWKTRRSSIDLKRLTTTIASRRYHRLSFDSVDSIAWLPDGTTLLTYNALHRELISWNVNDPTYVTNCLIVHECPTMMCTLDQHVEISVADAYIWFTGWFDRVYVMNRKTGHVEMPNITTRVVATAWNTDANEMIVMFVSTIACYSVDGRRLLRDWKMIAPLVWYGFGTVRTTMHYVSAIKHVWILFGSGQLRCVCIQTGDTRMGFDTAISMYDSRTITCDADGSLLCMQFYMGDARLVHMDVETNIICTIHQDSIRMWKEGLWVKMAISYTSHFVVLADKVVYLIA